MNVANIVAAPAGASYRERGRKAPMFTWTRAAAAGFVLLLEAAAGPPPAPTIAHTDTLFGMTFDDPYAWMEEGGPDFDTWIAGQSAYAREVLDGIPGRAALLAEIRRMGAGETRVGSVVAVDGQWFYSVTRPRDAVAKLFVRAGEHGKDRLLVDPARFDESAARAHIDYWAIAPDGRHLVYGVSVGGAETGTLRVMEVASGRDLPGQIDQTRYAGPSWRDNESFVYTRLPAPASDGRQPLTGGRVLLHRLGTDPASDPAVFGAGVVPGVDVPSDVFVAVYASPGSDQVVAKYDTGLASSEETLFIAPAASLDGGQPPWRRIAGKEDRVLKVALHNDWMYLRSALDAPQQKVLRTRLSAPDVAHAEAVVPEGGATVAAMVAAEDALYVRLLEDGLGQLLRVKWSGGEPEKLALPFEGSIMGMSANPAHPGVILRLQGWTESQTVFFYDPATGRFSNTDLAPPSPVSFADVAWSHVRAPSTDGAMVPLAILGKRDMPPGVPRPMLLYGYGSYNYALEATFNPLRRAWFDHGGVFAVAHVRGSGGFGDDWHQGGRLDTKPNSIADFIACAEYLVREGWTTPGMLGLQGASAGGIIVGGAITARPDLFSAAIINVGLVNALRLEQIPIGPFNTGEFGSTLTEEGVRMLHAIDVYQQVRPGVAYPGVLITTGRNDTRISAWMPAKLAARLQADTAGPRPVLLAVDETGGHLGSVKEKLEEETADFYSFLLWQAGVAGFQPTP
jgi:prolyl oligopeptidase